MLALRLAKIVMAGSLALFACVVAYDNVIDYGANYSFVRHVLSMDTIFPGDPLKSRAINNPVLWQAAYASIILGEALTGAAYTIGTITMLGRLRARSEAFERSKAFIFIATALGFLVWFLGFMVIGGEWFAMWQSPTWNGQPAAFRFYTAVLGVGIFIALRDRDPAG